MPRERWVTKVNYSLRETKVAKKHVVALLKDTDVIYLEEQGLRDCGPNEYEEVVLRFRRKNK